MERHEKNIFMPYLPKNFNHQINEKTSKSRVQSISENLSHQSNPVGRSHSESRNRYSNDVGNISRARPDLIKEFKCKEKLTIAVLKLFETGSGLFSGTDSRSWAMRLQTFI